ncbi:MAG TPA: hypothetical protein DCS81_00745 [Pantoea septica]|nr:hypothetical protein [Pantoea septica]
MYPDTDIRDLTESQKQTVSALSQMAAGRDSLGFGAGRRDRSGGREECG